MTTLQVFSRRLWGGCIAKAAASVRILFPHDPPPTLSHSAHAGLAATINVEALLSVRPTRRIYRSGAKAIYWLHAIVRRRFLSLLRLQIDGSPIAAIHVERYGCMIAENPPSFVSPAKAQSCAIPHILVVTTLAAAHSVQCRDKCEVAIDGYVGVAPIDLDWAFPVCEPGSDAVASFRDGPAAAPDHRSLHSAHRNRRSRPHLATHARSRVDSGPLRSRPYVLLSS